MNTSHFVCENPANLRWNLPNVWWKPSQLWGKTNVVVWKPSELLMKTWRNFDEYLANFYENLANSRRQAWRQGPVSVQLPWFCVASWRKFIHFVMFWSWYVVVVFEWESRTTWAFPSSSVFCASPEPLSSRRRRLLAGVVTPGACRPVVVVFFWPVV